MQPMRIVTLALCALSIAGSTLAAQAPRERPLSDFMTPQVFAATGMGKLTPAEARALAQWLSRFAVNAYNAGHVDGLQQSLPTRGGATRGAPSHVIDAAVNDETFVIGGDVYKAKLYCFDMSEGDRVIFADGTPGLCLSAKLVNTRTSQICEVWCE